MSQIKLLHSGGNGVILSAPTSNPSSDVTFKLPQADGSANQLLKTDGSGSLGWATDQGGKILQVVNGTTTTQVYGTSTSYADSGLTASITPASGTKILVILDQPLYAATNNYTGNAVMNMKVLRDSTQLTEYNFGRSTVSGNSWQEIWGTFAFTYLDTHGADGSTAVTYKTQYKADSSNVQAYVNRTNYGSPAVITSRSNIQLLEVAV